MKIRPKVPGAQLFQSAVRHEASYYRPLIQGGQTIWHRVRMVAQGQPHPQPAKRPKPLRISRGAGLYQFATAAGIIGFAAAGIAKGDQWCITLLPIAAVPGLFAWGGLRRKR